MTSIALPSVPAAPRVGVGRLARIYHDWNLRRRTRTELARLDAHLLRDIGIDRSDIPRFVDPGVELLRSAQVTW